MKKAWGRNIYFCTLLVTKVSDLGVDLAHLNKGIQEVGAIARNGMRFETGPTIIYNMIRDMKCELILVFNLRTENLTIFVNLYGLLQDRK